jgi:acetolactate synthase-1/2/3 large subunit
MLPVQPVRDYIKWDRQPVGAQEVADSFARAYRVTMQPPQGPVYLCYDAAFQEDPLEQEVPLPDPARVSPGTLPFPDPEALDQVADLLVGARMPVILAGYPGRDPSAFGNLVRLAEAAGAAVVDLNQRLNFPSLHPLNVSQAHTELLASADLVLAVEVKDLYGPLVTLDRSTRATRFITPPDCKIVEIGYRDLNISKWSDDFQQLVPVDVQILADSAPTLPLLADRVCARVKADAAADRRVRSRAEHIAAVHRAARARWQEEAKVDWTAAPMTTARLASEIWEVIRAEDWVLTSCTLEDWARKLWDFDRPDRYPGKSLGTSTQIGISLGVALAHKGSGKVVVDIQPDGDLMFDAGALWVAANQRLPMLVVMYNNRAYYNDWEHQIRMARQRGTPVENAWVGQAINDPAPDFAALARSFGWHAEGPVEDPARVGEALRRALAVVKQGRPALVDTVTRFR